MPPLLSTASSGAINSTDLMVDHGTDNHVHTSSSFLKHSSSSSSDKKKRSVTFDMNIHVVEVPCRQAYSRREASATWYTDRDLARIERDVIDVMIRQSSWTLRPGDCVRGLETMTKQGILRERRNRTTSRCAVFAEQLLQQKYGRWDQERIRSVYSQALRIISSGEEAIEMANQDAHDAELYQAEVPQEPRVRRHDRHSTRMNEEPIFRCWLFSPPKWLLHKEAEDLLPCAL